MRQEGLTIVAYSSGSTIVPDPLLSRAQNIQFSTMYPGGFEQASFFIPRDLSKPILLDLNHRVKIRCGLRTVWEGFVSSRTNDTEKGGTEIQCTGAFGHILSRRGIRKPWADTRIDEDVWRIFQTDKFDYSRASNQLDFMPKAVSFVANDTVSANYQEPTGQTVKRITFNYAFAEPAQQWTLRLWNATAGSAEWTVTATGTGSQDITFATPSTDLRFQYYANATQTGVADGTYYGRISNIVVYTETGSINLTEIAKDVRGYVSELSSYEGLIDSNTFSIVPFVADPLTYAEILDQAASYGDSSYLAWAYGVWESDLGTDDKPVLFVEQQPILTDYDYMIRLDQRSAQNARFEQSLDDVRNWIAVGYRDAEDRDLWVTPDDNANLKNTDSISSYGEFHEWSNLNTTSLTTATNYGRRFRIRRSDPQWIATSGFGISGFLYDKQKTRVSAPFIRAGKRLKVSNYLNDLSGTGLTWLITRTTYNHDTRSTMLEVGRPDQLSTLLAFLERISNKNL